MYNAKPLTMNIYLLTFLITILTGICATHASMEQLPDATDTHKKRARPADNIPSAGSSIHPPLNPIYSGEQTLQEPDPKILKLEEDQLPSRAKTSEESLSSQRTSSSSITINPTQTTSINTASSSNTEVDILSIIPSSESSSSQAKLETHTQQTFSESRVRTDKLAYFYEKEYFDFTDWETRSAKLVKDVTRCIHKQPDLKTINLALSQLSLIFEENGQNQKVDFMLPYFFMSRWPDERERKIITSTFEDAKAKVIHAGDSEYSYFPFHVGNGNNFTWQGYYKHFKEHLKNIISTTREESSSLLKERISRREAQINDVIVRNFSLNYFHSEQAILIYLIQKIDVYLPKILSRLTKEAVVKYLLLNIVSYNDMCERCGDTFFRASENKILVSIIEKYLKEHNYKIPPTGIHFFVACAGLEKYPNDDGTILRDLPNQPSCSISHINKAGIDLAKYRYPIVAQHYITEEGVKP